MTQNSSQSLASTGASQMIKRFNIVDQHAVARKQLGEGPQRKVFIGQENILTIPERLFVRCVPNASQFIVGGDIVLPADFDEKVARHFLTWLVNMTQKNHAHNLSSFREFDADMELLYVVRTLECEQYTARMQSYYKQWIHNIKPFPHPDTIEEIMAKVKDTEDPMLFYLADTIAYAIRNGQWPNMEHWPEYVSDFPWLAMKIDEINIPHLEARKARQVRQAAYEERVAKRAAWAARAAQAESQEPKGPQANNGNAKGQTKGKKASGPSPKTKNAMEPSQPRVRKDPKVKSQEKEDALRTSIEQKLASGLQKLTFDERDYARMHGMV